MESELFGDALGAQGRLVVHPAGPDQPGQQHAALPVAERGGLDRVLSALARNEGPPSGSARLGVSDLGLGAGEPTFDVLGLRVGEDVFQCPQPQPRPIGHREFPGRK